MIHETKGINMTAKKTVTKKPKTTKSVKPIDVPPDTWKKAKPKKKPAKKAGKGKK